jgi:adenylate kinase family enzyme
MSVIDFYKKLGKLIVINANQEKEKISSDLQKIVKNI